MITEELYIDKYILTEVDKQTIIALCRQTKNYKYICRVLNKLKKVKEDVPVGVVK